jgi:hypothetical protein
MSDDPADQPSWPPCLNRNQQKNQLKKNPEKSFRVYCN